MCGLASILPRRNLYEVRMVPSLGTGTVRFITRFMSPSPRTLIQMDAMASTFHSKGCELP
jgi:hypothetical protein